MSQEGPQFHVSLVSQWGFSSQREKKKISSSVSSSWKQFSTSGNENFLILRTGEIAQQLKAPAVLQKTQCGSQHPAAWLTITCHSGCRGIWPFLGFSMPLHTEGIHSQIKIEKTYKEIKIQFHGNGMDIQPQQSRKHSWNKTERLATTSLRCFLQTTTLRIPK